jgi:hypothetical protein
MLISRASVKNYPMNEVEQAIMKRLEYLYKEIKALQRPQPSRPHRSESLKNFAPAFINVLKEIPPVHLHGVNIHFRDQYKNPHRYATITTILNATTNILLKHDFMIEEHIEDDGKNGILVCEITHTSGEYISSRAPILFKEANNPHSYCSSITQIRRYLRSLLLGITAEDDDGNQGAGLPT